MIYTDFVRTHQTIERNLCTLRERVAHSSLKSEKSGPSQGGGALRRAPAFGRMRKRKEFEAGTRWPAWLHFWIRWEKEEVS